MNTCSSPSLGPAAPHSGARYELPTGRATAGGGWVGCPVTNGRVRRGLGLRGLAFILAAATTAGSVFGQQFEALHILPPDTGDTSGIFGKRVRVAPPWAVISDPSEGGVFLYARTPTGWRLMQSIIMDEPGSSFGDAMSIDGDTLVIGAPFWDFFGERKGRVFIYERDGTEWRRSQVLQPDGLRYNDRFGHAVAIDGDVLVVGAPNVDSPGNNHGIVFVYRRDGTDFELESLLRYDDMAGAAQHVGLGRAVAVSGSTVVASADLVSTAAGEVWVFERGDSDWRHTAVLSDPTPTNGDELGQSVAISRNTIVASEGNQAISFGWKQGSALVFDRGPGGDWQLVQEIEASDGYGGANSPDSFGKSVAIEGDTIVVAAPGSHTGGPHGGAVYLFERTQGGIWPQHETRVFVPSDANFSSTHIDLGEDVELRDGFVLAGSAVGRSAYVFEIESGSSFCNPAPNSTGEPAHLALVFSAAGEGTLSVHDAPPSTAGAFLASPARAEIVFQPSSLCLGEGMWILAPIAPTGGAGVAMHEMYLGRPAGFVSGVTFYFQYWFQDSAAAVGSFNFSNAVATALP